MKEAMDQFEVFFAIFGVLSFLSIIAMVIYESGRQDGFKAAKRKVKK